MSLGSTLSACPAIRRMRRLAMPWPVSTSRAATWFSVSESMLVRTPSAAMPASSASPDTPVPVPISATALADTVRARKVRTAATPVLIGSTPNSSARWRARSAPSDSAVNASA